MAEVVPITGTPATAKIRNPLGVIGLTLITLGIYYFFWYYFVNREMKDLGESRGTDECGESPGTSVVAITLGAFIIVPAFLSHYNSFKRMNAASRLTGAGDGFDAGLGLLLWVLLSPVAVYLFQMNLNKVWEAQRGAVAAAPAAAIEATPQSTAPEAEPAAPSEPAADEPQG
ncbi:MAG: DUF4234 domain-containing protein [Solirubrobacteraceae bacterium]|jgi:hypothetical protein|nr:DUF4234 domain-containing protein [Solirubrobacteraceae bacterium]MDP4672112.1 DUF4234 domain-containing protein [Solirubrobacteraceae bacterium]MDP4921647.1 DUF4234 domain-containing protein [Solirubrobacteraceae bacterium]